MIKLQIKFNRKGIGDGRGKTSHEYYCFMNCNVDENSDEGSIVNILSPLPNFVYSFTAKIKWKPILYR